MQPIFSCGKCLHLRSALLDWCQMVLGQKNMVHALATAKTQNVRCPPTFLCSLVLLVPHGCIPNAHLLVYGLVLPLALPGHVQGDVLRV